MSEYDWFKLKLPVCKKEITLRNWNYIEDVNLNKKITNLGENSKLKEIEIILEFLRNHCKEQELFDSLCEVDIYKILFVLRNNSKGNEIKYMWKCQNDSCTAKNQFQHTTMDVIKDVKYSLSKKYNVKISDKYTIIFKEISFVKKLKIISEVKDMEELKFILVINNIGSIIKDDELLTFSNIEELSNFVESMEPKYVNKIIDVYNSSISNIEIIKKNHCISCKKDYDLQIGDFSFFL